VSTVLPRTAPVSALLSKALPWIAALAAIGLVLDYVIGHAIAELGARYQLIDDAYYYLEIADNLRTGCGASFNCRNPTNGYHPLWLLLLTGLTVLLPAKGDAQVWLMQAAGILLFFAAAAVTTATARRLMPEARVAPYVPAVLIAANPSLFYVAINGLETPAALLTLALLALACVQALTRSSATASIAVGTAGALAFLARLDYAIVAGLAVGALLLADLQRLRRPSGGAICATLLLGAVVAGYLLANLLLFDAAMPVSGSIKQTSLADRLQLGALYGPAGAVSALAWPLRFVTWPGNPLLLAAAGVVTLAAAILTLRSSPARLRDLFLLLSGWVHAALYLALQSSGPEYYFVPLILSVAWSGAVVVRAIERRLGRVPALMRAIPLGLAVLAVAGPLTANRVLDRDRPVVPWRLDRLRAVAWMNETLPPDAVIGSWWSGAIGYYADRPVVNLDGLVNGPAYLDVLRGCRLGRYLIDSGITHLADYATSAMIERGAPDEALFPGRCWAELWADLAAAGYRLEKLRVYPDPQFPAERGFAVLAIRRP
jgi:hypothetical protein